MLFVLRAKKRLGWKEDWPKPNLSAKDQTPKSANPKNRRLRIPLAKRREEAGRGGKTPHPENALENTRSLKLHDEESLFNFAVDATKPKAQCKGHKQINLVILKVTRLLNFPRTLEEKVTQLEAEPSDLLK
ncbi:hypothetical protein VN12_01230 [Pirellula sp. SH-Sr6A]|nr:hypothetical protein VN12_01230 [Pirellula sp. SH-Sr6A]